MSSPCSSAKCGPRPTGATAHIQLPDWTDYRADFSLLNGRVYPDTLAPNGSIDPFNPVRDANGDLIAPAGGLNLQYQPLSALVTCQPGERVLLRFANLGFREGRDDAGGHQDARGGTRCHADARTRRRRHQLSKPTPF